MVKEIEMKWIEHRRHAQRTKPSPHLNREGVQTARHLGLAGAGPFHRVVTSPKKRSVETAVAMGFAVDATTDALLDLSNKIPELDSESRSFYELSEKLPHVLREGSASRKYLLKMLDLFVKELEKAPEGARVLMVSHGGVVEWSALAAFPEGAALLGPAIETSEGIELAYKSGEFCGVRALRLDELSFPAFTKRS